MKKIINIISLLMILILLFQFSPVKADVLTIENNHPGKTEITNVDFLDNIKADIYTVERKSEIKSDSIISEYPTEINPLDNEPPKKEYNPPTEEELALTAQQVRSFDCSTVTDVPQIECETLVDLYESTNGAGWSDNTYWLTSTKVTDWFGVSADDGHILTIQLWYNNLNGTIPATLGNLGNLKWLALDGNQLKGLIPTELSQLNKLERFGFSSNQLTGIIPSWLGNLNKLEFLTLYENQLTGTIPTELVNLSSLRHLNLGFNQLTGTIPASFRNLSNLEGLALDNNQLTGVIPPGLGYLTNLQSLLLNSNQLTGTIPSDLGNLSNLTRLRLEINQLTGSIPNELGNLIYLKTITLNDNHLTGAIPSVLGNLKNLNVLYLSNNQLTGTIPPELGNLGSLIWLQLQNNQLNGEITDDLCNLTDLETLNLGNNQLTGSIPSDLGKLIKLTNLGLGNNQLTGVIPPGLGYLTNLQSLLLNSNQLTGTIPSVLGDLQNLYVLSLSNNQLIGSIPPELGNLRNVWSLDLESNHLTGSIPSSLAKLKNLTQVWFNNNPLTGALPLSLILLENLSWFIFTDTNICEPNSIEYNEWKNSINYFWGTGNLCFQITHIEYTQAIQDIDNSAPMIAGKNTLVRVFVEDEGGPISELSGSLEGWHDGVKLSGTPQKWIIKRSNIGTLNFILPSNWTAEGSLKLIVKVSGLESEVRYVTFTESPEIRIVYIPINYYGFTVDNTDMIEAISWMRDAYPSSNIIYERGSTFHWKPNLICHYWGFLEGYCQSEHLINDLNRLYKDKYEEYDFIIGWVPKEAWTLEFIKILGGSSDPLWNEGLGKAVWVAEDEKMGEIAAHEIGHLLDQRHSNTETCKPIDPETEWPWETSFIQDTGWRANTFTFFDRFRYYDFMSYCSPRWISVHTYNSIYTYWNEYNKLTLNTLSRSESALIISGLISKNDQASINPVWEKENTSNLTNPPIGKTYCVQVKDSSDFVLDEYCFDLDFIDHVTQEPLDVESYFIMLPVFNDFNRIEIRKGETLLAYQQRSLNSPNVNITSPNGGELWSAEETQSINWSGSDLDDDILSYSVYYSSDNGLTWEPLALDLDATSLELHTADLPGSISAKIKVVVSDGINIDSDESDTSFTVESKSPQANILIPEDGMDYLAGRFVNLNGIGHDLEDGTLDGSKLCWSSSIDGDLGCGQSLSTTLSNGEHTITLDVVDADNNSGFDTAMINMIECYSLNTYAIPKEGGIIKVNVEPNCTADESLYKSGTEITLDIEPNVGYSFFEWGDSIIGSEVPKLTTIDQDMLVNAKFVETSSINIFLPLVIK